MGDAKGYGPLMGSQGAKTKQTEKDAPAQRAARQRILSDVIMTRALYTPLVYVFLTWDGP